MFVFSYSGKEEYSCSLYSLIIPYIIDFIAWGSMEESRHKDLRYKNMLSLSYVGCIGKINLLENSKQQETLKMP